MKKDRRCGDRKAEMKHGKESRRLPEERRGRDPMDDLCTGRGVKNCGDWRLGGGGGGTGNGCGAMGPGDSVDGSRPKGVEESGGGDRCDVAAKFFTSPVDRRERRTPRRIILPPA